VALIAVLATVGVLIPMLNSTSVAYASAGTPATFLSTRSVTINNPGSEGVIAAYKTYTYFGGNFYA